MDRETSTDFLLESNRSLPIERPMDRPLHAGRTTAGRGRQAAVRKCSRRVVNTSDSTKPDVGGSVCDQRTRLGRGRVLLDERWDCLLECTPDLVVVVDGDGLVSYINHIPAQLTGGRADIVGCCFYDFLAPEYRVRVRASIGRVFQTGETIRQVVCFSANGSGVLRGEVCIGPITRNGRVVAAGMFCADITEREKLESRLRDSEMLLSSIVRAVPKMVDILEGAIRHGPDAAKPGRRTQEIQLCREHMLQIGRLASIGKVGSGLTQRLPQFLTAIGMSIENAMTKLDAASCRDEVGRELEAALRVIATLTADVEQVRGFAATACRHPLVHAVDLRAILVGVVQVLKAGARRMNTVIRIEGPDELPPVRMATGDAEQLFFSLFEDLLRSADGGKHNCITVSSIVNDHSLELRFAGQYHREENESLDAPLDRLFTVEPVVKAADLGLHVAWDVVAQAGGTIRRENTATTGLTFFVRLPIADSPSSEWDQSGEKWRTTCFRRR